METRGRELLTKFLAQPGWNQTRLAELLGIAQPSVSLWVHGIARPEPHHRTALQRLTQIDPDDWLSKEERESLKATLKRINATGTDG